MRRITILVALAALLLALPALPAHAQDDPAPPANAAAEDAPAPPPEAEEVQGTCRSPRQAWLQLLYWLQQGTRWEPERAAACFDAAGLADPARAPELAVRLKKVVDARALWVPVDNLPTDFDYRNSDGLHSHVLFRDELGGVTLVRKGGRWLFAAGTLSRVDGLYRDTVPQGLDRLVSALPDWFRKPVLGVEIWQILGVFVLIFLGFLVQKLVVFFIARYLSKLVSRISMDWVGKVARRIDRPVGGLAMAGVLRLGVPVLQFPVKVSKVAIIATAVLAAFSLVWLAYRLIDVLTDWLEAKAEATDTKLDDQLVPLLRKSLKVFIAVIGGIFILQNLNVDVGSLLAGLGLGGLAFALAAKDTVANFFGSVMIFIDKPFQIGDWILVAGVEGTVEEVGFRTTRVRTFYNSVITVPNSMIVTSSVDNMGARRYRRYKTTLGLTYDTPPEKVQAFLEGVRGLIQAMPGMRKDFYLVEFQDYGDSSLNMMLYCFMDVPDWAAEMRTRTFLNLEILRLAKELGVSFAFPTRTLHVDSLAAPGTRPEEPKVPPAEELAAVVKAFAPGGKSFRPRGIPLAGGYDPGKPIDRGSDAGDA